MLARANDRHPVVSNVLRAEKKILSLIRAIRVVPKGSQHQSQHYPVLAWTDLSNLPRANSTGVAMLVPITPSKSVEIVGTEILELPANTGQPLIETTLRWGGKEVVVLSLSIARPRNRGASAFQQVEFDAAAEWSLPQQTKDKREVVVIGDFNTTPWSGRFRKFLKDSNLRNSLRGFGLQPTWHAALPSPLMIAIDHCLHSKSITTINRATGSNIGSDHLPLFVELARGERKD